MQCPYCTSKIDDAAVVCPVCTRDLYLIKPLQEKVAGLEARIEELSAHTAPALEARITELENELAGRKSDVASAVTHASRWSFAASAAMSLFIALVLLLAAHALIVVLYDLKPLVLRIASLLIPLPFGLVMHVRHPTRVGLTVLLSVIVGVLAVLAMSAVTAWVDNVPVLPENLRDWREFIEYAASIAFSFITGLFLAKLMHAKRTAEAGPITLMLARLFTFDEDGELGLQKMVVRVNKMVAAFTPAAAAAVSIYTGIKAVVGG